MLPWEIYGSRKRQRATESALNKVLMADILQCLCQPAVICCNDDNQCYNHIVHSVARLCMQKMGAPQEVPMLLLGTLAELKRYIQTSFGDSSSHYGSIRLPPLQGICQGNRAGPSIWCIVSTPIITMLKKEGFGLRFESAITKEHYHFVARIPLWPLSQPSTLQTSQESANRPSRHQLGPSLSWQPIHPLEAQPTQILFQKQYHKIRRLLD